MKKIILLLLCASLCTCKKDQFPDLSGPSGGNGGDAFAETWFIFNGTNIVHEVDANHYYKGPQYPRPDCGFAGNITCAVWARPSGIDASYPDLSTVRMRIMKSHY